MEVNTKHFKGLNLPHTQAILALIKLTETTGCLKYGVASRGIFRNKQEHNVWVEQAVNTSPIGTKTCKDIGSCYRMEKFGSDSNKYRNVGCRALHAEQKVILGGMKNQESHRLAMKGTLYVTAHPCNMCAKLIAECQLFDEVIYLAPAMDELSQQILENAKVTVTMIVGAPFSIASKDY